MKKRKKIQIFRLEDRVLFEGAAAAEAVATVDHAGSPSHADKPADHGQDAKDSAQKDAVHNVVQSAGPVSDSNGASSSSSSNSTPNAPVQDHGAGLPSADHAAADPTAALVDGTAHLDKVTDPGESFSTDLSDFMHSDLSSVAHTTSSALFSSSLPGDADHANTDSLSHSEAKELVVIEADAVDNIDPHTLEGKEVLVLHKDADTAAQIDAYLEAHSDTKYDAIEIVSNKAETTLTSDSLTTDAVTEIQSHLTDHGSLGFVDVADFNADPANVHHDLSHGADSHSTDDIVVFPDHDAQVTVDATTELTTGVSDTTDTTVPESLLENADTESHELVIVNSNMADLDNVLSQLGDSRDVLIIDVNSSESATQQIQDYLDAHSDTTYDSVHILTHGSSDGFTLGNTVVNDASDMAVFNGHLTQDGDIMIYGCNLASTEAGQHLINDIADVTGADVAASADMTGAAAVGGNWTLEYASGTIETTTISLDSSWDYRLATLTVDGIGTDPGHYTTIANALAAAASGDDIDVLSGVSGGSATISLANITITGDGSAGTLTINALDADITIDTVTSITVSASGSATIDGSTVTGAVNVSGDLTITSGTFNGAVTNNLTGDLTINGGTFGGTITNNHTADINGGTFNGAVTNGVAGTMTIDDSIGTSTFNSTFTNNGTVDATGGTFTNTFTNNGTFNIGTVSGSDSLVTFNTSGTNPAIVNNGDLNVSGLSASDTATLDINVTGGATATGIRNTGTGTVDVSSFGTIDITTINTTTTAYGINNAGGAVVIGADGILNVDNTLSGASPTSYGIYNTGSVDLDASGAMNFGTSFTNAAGYTDSYNRVFGIYNLAGTLNLSGGTLTTTSNDPDGNNLGTGIYNTGTLNVLVAGTTITGFEYGVRGTTVIGRTDYETPGLIDLSGNTWEQVIPLQITANSSILAAGYNQYEFENIDDALDYASTTSSSAFDINFVLDYHYYNSWTAATTIYNDGHVIGNNVFSINGNDFVYDVPDPANPLIHYNTQTTINIAAGVTLTVASYGRTAYDATALGSVSKTLILNNISFSVLKDTLSNSVATLLFAGNTDTDPNQYSRVTFSGDGVGYSYVGYVNDGVNVTWTGVASSYTSARVLNAGIVTINGEVIHNSSAVLAGRVVYTVWNTDSDALLTIDGQYGAGILDVNDSNHTTYAIYNQYGTVDILNAASVDLTSDGTGSAAIYNAKSAAGTNAVTIGREDIADGSTVRITATGASGESYAIYNNEGLVIYNSFIRAVGASSIGLFNSTDGDATFTVTFNPSAYVDLSGFPAGSDAANALLFGTKLFGITGGDYSLYNYNQFTMTYGGSVAAALFTSAAVDAPYFFNVPVMALNGEVHTEAKASTPTSKTTTNLNGVTVFGNITNNGTALVMLNDVYLNGNLFNTGSNVYVTGSFRSSDFYFGSDISHYQQYHGQSTTSITIMNLRLTGSAGNIYFGTNSAGDLTDVAFESTQDYQFYNLAGTMTIQKYKGLSSEDHPILIYNQGVFTIDGSTATSGLAANGSYDLYVSSANSIFGPHFGDASNVSDSGIVNYDVNPYNPVYYVVNDMTLTSLNIRNTQANSVAVTNYAGNLTINNGSLQGSYSGLDTLFDIYVTGNFSTTMTFYVKTSVTNLNQVEKIAGSAYSIRNSGKLNLDGTGVNMGTTNGTLLTNVLDFTSAYTGAYTALLNVSPTVYLNEYYASTPQNYFNDLYAYFYTEVQAFSASYKANAQTPASLVPARVSLSYFSSDDVFSKSDIAITTYADMITRVSSTGTYINWHYGNYAVTADANLDYVAFYATATTDTNTAMMNWGDLTVTNINGKDEYQFTGFTVSIDNGDTPFWATDYIQVNHVATANNLNNDWLCSPNFTSAVAQYFTVKGDIEVGFDLQSSTILTSANSYDTSELTFRGVFDTTSDYTYNGRMLVSGSRYVVFVGKTLTLVNFSVYATGSDAIYNAGLLHIFNGIQQSDGSWIGGSTASIQATGNTGIVNNGSVFMLNGAVLNCNIGITHMTNAGYLAIVNSTIAKNTTWGIVSNRTAPSGSGTFNFAIVDSTIVANGEGKYESGGGIQLNNGQLDLVNSIVLNYKATDISNTSRLNTSSGMVDSNIFGTNTTDTATKLNAVYGTTSPTLQYGYVYALVDGSSALTGGITFSYTIDSSGSPTHFYYGSTTGDIDVTWDKLGNTRTTEIGSYVLTSGPVPPTTSFVVTTLFDDNGAITGDSLREVIERIYDPVYNPDGETTITFDWAKIEAEMISQGWTVANINLVAANGALHALDGTITIDASGYTTTGPVTVVADAAYVTAVGDSVFVVSGTSTVATLNALNVTVTAGADVTTYDGGAARVDSGRLILKDLTITGSDTIATARNGGGVYVAAGASLTLSSAAFVNNRASASGGAIYNDGTVLASSGSSSFTNNSAVNGGAIYATTNSTTTLTSASFSTNRATVNGGAVYQQGGTATFTSSSFTDSSAVDGGAVYVADGTFTASSSSFTTNTATGDGGAIYVLDGTVTLTGASGFDFDTNTATGDGGAVFVMGGDVTVSAYTFVRNTAENGGAVYVGGGTFTADSGTVFNANTAIGDGGAIYAGGSGDVLLDGTYLYANIAENGGALYVDNTATVAVNKTAVYFNRASGEGTAFYVNAGRLDVTNSTVADNGKDTLSGTGDAGYSIYATDTASLYLVDSTIADNTEGVYLGGNTGEKVLLNSILLNVGVLNNLTGVFSNNGLPSYQYNYIGDTAAERTEVFGTNVLIIDSANDKYGTISLLAEDANPAYLGGVLVALDGTKYVYSDDNGTTWRNLDGTITTLSSSAVKFTQDQLGHSRSMGTKYSMGAVSSSSDNLIVVNTSADTIDSDDTITSLREAILQAEAYLAISGNSGKSVRIVFDAASSLIVNNTITVTYVLPNITGNISIDGYDNLWNPTSINLTVTAATATNTDGTALTVSPLTITAGKLSISNLTFIGGSLITAAENGYGGMFSVTGGEVAFQHVTIKGGQAANGGAIYVGANATVTLESGTILQSNNAYYLKVTTVDSEIVTTYYMGNGGAVYNEGTLYVTNTTITANSTGGGFATSYDVSGKGGGIYNTGTVEISASAFTGNYAGKAPALDTDADNGQGGAIYNAGTLRVYSATMNVQPDGSYKVDSTTQTTFLNNHSYLDGGAIYNAGIANIYLEGNIISGNNAVNGGAFYNTASLTITDNATETHRPTYKKLGNNGAVNGGAIYNASGTLNLSFISVVGNTATTDGSAIYFASGNGTFLNATFAENSGTGATVSVLNTAGVLNLNFVTIATNLSTGLNIAGGSVGLKNTLIAINGSDGASDLTGTYTNNLGNVISNGNYQSTLLFETGTLNTTDGTLHLRSTLLNPAAVNGVLDSEPVDQNGQTRYYDATAKEASVGAWAFTTKPTTGYRFVVTTGDDVVNDGDGLISLREAITYVNSQGGGTVYFDYAEIIKNTLTHLPILSVDATLGTFTITTTMTIDGISYYEPDPNDSSKNQDFRAGYHNVRLKIDGSALTAASVFTITNAAVTFTTLDMVGGTTSGNGGVFNITGLTSGKTIILTDLDVSGGKATTSGGALYQDSGNLLIQGSNFYGATAGVSGGSIYFAGSSLTITANTDVILRETDNGDGTFTVDKADYVNSNFYSNTATTGSGGAIYFAGTNLSISAGNIVTETSELYSGTGIYDPSKTLISTTVTDISYGFSFVGLNKAGASGGAIYIGANAAGSMSTVSLSDLYIYQNEATGSGGGIYMTNGNLTLSASQLYSNISGSTGGGIYFEGDGSLYISGSYINNNTATGSGGGIYFTGNTLSITGNTSTYLTDSTINPDGSITVVTVNAMNSEVYGNTSKTGSGGGIYFAGNTLTLSGVGTDVTQTTTVYEPDGSIRSQTSTTLADTSDILIVSNTATAGDGGAVYIQENTSADTTLRILLTNAYVYGNQADKGRGGAFFLTPNDTFYFSATNTTVTGNSALNGGAFYFASEISEKATLILPTLLSYNYAEQNGGAIYAVGNLKWSSAVTFIGNTAKGKGGALYVEGNLEISGSSVFSSNGTTGKDGDGGAIYVGGNLTISGGTFTNNYVSGVFGDGGAIYVVGTVDMSGSVTFTGNEATSGGRGGAVYVGGGASGGASKIDGVTATLNFGADGGVFYFASGTVTIAGRSAVSLNNNTGMDGGAIYIASGTTVTIGTKSFSLNNNMAITGILLNPDGTSDSSVWVGGNGGAIYNNGTLTINRTNKTWLTFAGNQAVGYDKFTDTGRGGFIYNVGTVELSYVNVNNSASSRSGGAIYSYGSSSSVSLTMTNFTGNQTKAFDAFYRNVGSGSIFVDATKAEGNGGAVYMEGGTLTIDSSTFTNNSATNIDDKGMNVDRGGAVYFSGSGALTIKSTVRDTSYTISVIATTTFSGNEAARGGALYVDAATGATVSISDVSVENNIGRYTTEDGISSNAAYVSQGAGFWLGGSSSVRITIENTTFSGNTQEYITWGGGLYATNVGLNLINTTFYNNTANHGGGLYIASANVSMVNSTVGYNTVTDRLHSGLGGGGILVTGANTTLNMLNTVVAGNINTRYAGTSSNYQYNDIVFKVASFDNITMKYNVLGYAWNSIDSTTYSELTAAELGSTNTYEQLGSDVFQQQTVGGVQVPVFGRFMEWSRYYAASNVIYNPVYATTATLMIRPDGVAAYKGVYSAIDRTTGALYYNTINSSKVTSTTDISGSWVNFADDSPVTITDSNIVTNGQNGWTRTDQLTFNTYNVGAHALKSLDANYYAGPDYEYDVSTTYYVNPTVTKAYTDATQYYYDAFNPYDGAITLREAVFLAGQTLTRSYYSSDPDVQSLKETFVFSTDIRFNTDPNYPGNVFGTMDGGSPTSTYYTPTTNVFTGYEVIQLDSEFYGALTFSKTDDAKYTLAGYGTDGSYLAITLSGGAGLLNMTSGDLSLYGFEALLGGTATAGGVFNVSGGDLSVSYVRVISGGNAETGGVLYQTGGNVTIGTLDYTIVMSGNDASTGGVIAYQTGGNLLLINTFITQNNIADVASDSLFQLSGGAITLLNSTVYYNYGQSLSILTMSAGSTSIADSTIAFNGVTSSGYTAGMNITGGTLNVLNSIIDFTLPAYFTVSQSTTTTTTTDEEGNETTTTSTQSSYTSIYTLNVISSLIGYLNTSIFVMDGDLPLVGNNGTLVISSSGLAATDGVMVGYITDSNGVTTVYYKTSEDARWISISANKFLDPSYNSLVTVITNGQNGAVRNYAGYDYLSIGAYSMPARGIPGAYTLIVTISGDIWDAGDNETSLREALYLAGKLYELDGGITWTITFADSTGGNVVVDTSLMIDGFNVIIEGGTGINVSSSATYVGDSIFVVRNGSSATLNNLTIQGVSDAALFGGAINVTDSTLTLNNTALVGGMVALGGALYADGSTVTMNGGSIVGGSATQGGGIYGENSTVKLTGVTVSGNSSTAAGGGIYLAGGSLSATSSVFVNNTAGTSGGAVYSTSGTLSIQNSTFVNNTAAVSGGAVYNLGANGTVSGTFTNNDATAGSGGAVYNGTGVLSVSGTFTDNNAGVNGGAIYNATGTLYAAGSFTTNTAANGGAIYNADGTLSVVSGTFTNNTVVGDGGAIYNENGALGVSGSTFEGNNATNGGAVYTSGTNSSVSGVFDNNFASGDGGAIYTVGALLSASGTFTGNLALGNGGAIYNAGQKLNATGTFAGNTAASGNGGAVYNLTQASVSGIFQGNIAMIGNGGAVYNSGMVTLSGGFSDNLAEDGAVLYNTGSADLLNFNIASNEAHTGSIVTSVGANADLYLNNGSFSDNTGVNLVTTDGHAALLTVTTAANHTTSSLVNAASLDLLNSSITGTTGDSSALIRATTSLQIANSIVVGNSAADTAVDATGAVKFYTAYSIFSGNAAQLANASVNVENLTGNSVATVFGAGQLNAFGQLVIPDDSPAAMGVWTTYNRATGAIHYSTRPEGIWTVGYNVNNVQWNYLGPGNNMAGFSLSNLVVGNGHPSIGAYWLNSSSSLPDFGPGVNTDLANPSYNGMAMEWGYNSVIDAFLADPGFYLTMSGEFSMDWMESLSRQLFGVPYMEINTFSVFGGRGDLGAVPSGEYGLGISINGAASDDFTRFEETPYHSDGTPLTEDELELIRNAAVKGAVEEEVIPTLSETIGEKVLSALRSADIFKDSFDKALDQLLGVDA